ncbi:MAG TPA: phosphoribosylaminoimidazolesuccinocarboxamide synthase [Candidatus Brocadiia bacterium]|nr:phosphoribosylaminoimidazolesuccinocarboxamide synthase [Planctomycetota bacterium]MBI4008531.1 phosphoribosylaminoimidazolesuccinocarboxamide synthase [Planctomycetota bacterium]MDO8094494.1 phosphoribosylaminoimidazolesuccinocarboxamide synthase [Candidatus Brocadiales bacterium]
MKNINVVINTDIPELSLFNRGKVRDIYEVGKNLLIVTTDRISAFDSVLPNGIPYKGKALTLLSKFWFNYTSALAENHLITTDIKKAVKLPEKYVEMLSGRSMLVKKAKVIPIECVVRGYLAGSAWKEYKEGGSVCGIKLSSGLKECDGLAEPIFTPAIKATSGHDVNISYAEASEMVGEEVISKLRERSIAIYKKACDYAIKRGIIISDTKFEWGMLDSFGLSSAEDRIILIDELLTPDSSRFWPLEGYTPGRAQPSFDKQFVRDYLEKIGWDKNPPAPPLPDEIVQKTSEKYIQAYRMLTGKKLI